jgi:predicted nucleotidyltransferase
MEIELARDFKELLKSLNENGVKYLLIGGYAVVLHGYVRNTVDLDIAVSDDVENARRIVKALNEFGLTSPNLSTDLFTKTNSLVRMGVEPVQVEILNYLAGLEFDDAFERRIQIKVEDITINVISLADLIKNKEAVGRLQDLADVEKLKKHN